MPSLAESRAFGLEDISQLPPGEIRFVEAFCDGCGSVPSPFHLLPIKPAVLQARPIGRQKRTIV